ncbi:MAG: carbohydrate kinase [Bacteroidales bacterium]|nr:carbohydrate kinase [Bacteroidales bacterium]
MKIVGLGEALWDMLPEGKKIGGAPANFAFHASQFGLDGYAASAVGNDALGDEILETFDQKGLRYVIERVDYPTGTVQVELDAKGVPQYDIREGAAWDNIPWTSAMAVLAADTQAVCFGSLAQRSEGSRRTIRRFLEAMPEGSLKVFDINLRQHFYTPEVLEESMRLCDILKINDEELVIVSRMLDYSATDVQDRCRRLINDYGLKMLILTCGTCGSYVFGADGSVSFLPTPKVEVADTVGAGDSFTGSFVASLLKGASIPEAHRRAVDVSAYVCTQPGAMPQLPSHLLA